MKKEYRKAHILRENKRGSLPKAFVFMDSEANIKSDIEGNEYDRFRLGCAVYWRRYYGRRNDTLRWFDYIYSDDFWLWLFDLFSEVDKICLISHNIVYDLKLLDGFFLLHSDGWECKSPVFNNQTVILKYVKNKKTLLILNNANFFTGKLEDIGKSVGLDKIDVDFYNCTNELLFIHCRRDVEILLAIWQKYVKFIQSEDIGGFQKTIASQSMGSYRHRFMDHKIYIHNSDHVIKLERESYHGGRSECFKLGSFEGGDYYNLDVNSMYPSVMYDNQYPTKLIRYGNGLRVSDLRKLIKYCHVIAKVKLVSNVNIYPAIIGKRLLFPVGSFITTLTTPELVMALNLYHIKEIYDYAIYEKAHIFKGFVDYFYNKRKEAKASGNDVLNLFFRLILNSLYGKFGQKGYDTKLIGDCDLSAFGVEDYYNTEDERWYKLIYLNGKIYQVGEEGESFNSFVAISSHITAYSRMRLYHYMQLAGHENIYYCDTDSIFTNKQGYLNLKEYIHKDFLGYLSIKDKAKSMIIKGVKDYIFGSNTKIKGIRKDAVQLADNIYSQVHFLSIKGLLRKKIDQGVKKERIIKTLSREYYKGCITSDVNIAPVILSDHDFENYLNVDMMIKAYSNVSNMFTLQEQYKTLDSILFF